MKPIPYGKQNITKNDIEAVKNVLKSDFLTQGPEIEKFEKNFSSYINSKYSVAVSNGTAALHLSVLALGLKKGDKVITSPITFAASANCVRYCGAEIVFCDIDPITHLLDHKKVEELLQKSKKGEYKGIIPVNFAGRACDLEKFNFLAKKYDLWILEDSCHSPGGYFYDSNNVKQYCGGNIFTDLSIFSFHPVKHIAAGEGGMITTNNEKLYKKLLTLRTHGITKNKNNFKNSIKIAGGNDAFPNWYMEMQELGFNYRLTDIQCALANSQLSRANDGLQKRKEIAEKYFDFFSNKPYIFNQSGKVKGHAYHLYVIEVKNRLGLYNFLKEKNIYTQIHYFPCHLMPYYKDLGWSEGDLINAENYYQNCISLPIYPTLKQEEQDYVIKNINEFYNE